MRFDNVTTTMGEETRKKSKAGLQWVDPRSWFARLPLVYLFMFLIAVYIFSAHQAEKKVREIQRLQADLTELKWEYTSLNSNWIYSSTRSQVAEKVKPLELKWTSRAPILIEASKRNY
jgi:cell division protein FtsB